MSLGWELQVSRNQDYGYGVHTASGFRLSLLGQFQVQHVPMRFLLVLELGPGSRHLGAEVSWSCG